jgi:phosphoglycerate dehydrogenase-like enzyme
MMSETYAREQENVEGKDRTEKSPPDLTGTDVAVIGTGTMGAAVARRLLSSGASVDVWNRSPQPTRELASLECTMTRTKRSPACRWC